MEKEKDARFPQLRKRYEELRKKYGLPDFDEMNKDFYIEKIDEAKSDFLIREIKGKVGDKLANYMKFLENLINPVQAPMFIFSILKAVGNEDKKKISDVYRKLVKSEMTFIALDLEFDEAREARFIKNSFQLWQSVKLDLKEVFDVIEKNLPSSGKGVEDNKGYFG